MSRIGAVLALILWAISSGITLSSVNPFDLLTQKVISAQQVVNSGLADAHSTRRQQPRRSLLAFRSSSSILVADAVFCTRRSKKGNSRDVAEMCDEQLVFSHSLPATYSSQPIEEKFAAVHSFENDLLKVYAIGQDGDCRYLIRKCHDWEAAHRRLAEASLSANHMALRLADFLHSRTLSLSTNDDILLGVNVLVVSKNCEDALSVSAAGSLRKWTATSQGFLSHRLISWLETHKKELAQSLNVSVTLSNESDSDLQIQRLQNITQLAISECFQASLPSNHSSTSMYAVDIRYDIFNM